MVASKIILVACLLASGCASVARASCDELRAGIAGMAGDTTITFSSGAVDCPILADNELEEFVIEGGVLTLTGVSTTKFTNMRFTVVDGAGIIFDFAKTEFGPNEGFDFEDDYGGFMLQVYPQGSAEFTGEMEGTVLDNMRSVFFNEGSMEFRGNANLHDVGTNVFRDNLGTLIFDGDVTMENNRYLAIRNDGGSVSIAGESLFSNNGFSFDGHSGGAFANVNGGTSIFEGNAVFSDNSCDESGGGAYNTGEMTFSKKVYFFDNYCQNGNGGAMLNRGGTLTFGGAVQMRRNDAREGNGGGLAVEEGGSVSFGGWVTIESNTAAITGGAMAIEEESTVTIRRLDRFRFYSNSNDDHGFEQQTHETSDADGGFYTTGCNEIFVDDTSTINLEGDICQES